MPLMPDLRSAMKSFQEALQGNEIQLLAGELDRQIFAYVDGPGDSIRLTYVRLEGQSKVVSAFVTFVPCEPVDGVPCFNVGWAVPKKFQRQGRAKNAFKAAVNEMRNGFSRNGGGEFYVEAIVSTDNLASQRVAEAVISHEVTRAIDSSAGVPIIQYLRKIDASTIL